MKIRTIEWKRNKIRIINQTGLPCRLEYKYIKDLKTLWSALKRLQIRGAPAIGAAAALGVFLGVKNLQAKDFLSFSKRLERVIKYIGSARPTAVNLFWALQRMRDCAFKNKDKEIPRLKKILLKEAQRIMDEDRKACRRMADFGARLIKNGSNILTICNAGALATVDYGTALGIIYRARELKKRLHVYVCETRPLLQGARLTSWELRKNRVPATLITDNMAATLMREGRIDLVIAGADRIAANADTANKIGTYNLAVLAKFHKIPFYIAAPASSFDPEIKSGRQIPIEQRAVEEVTTLFFKKPIAPKGIRVYNPAFDVTPHKLITAIITEKGILRAPYRENIKRLLR